MTFIVNMSIAQLATAAAEYRVKLPPHNPMGLPSGKPTEGRRLPSVDWPAGTDVAEVLTGLAEAPFARVLSFSVDTVEVHHIAAAGEEHNAIFTLTNDDVGLIHGLSDTQVIATFAEMFSATQAAPPLGIGFEMSEAAMPVFLAMIDRVRLMVFASYIERTGLTSLAMSADHIQEQLVQGDKIADFRWLSALYPFISDQSSPSTKKAIAAAMEELIEADLVSIQKNGRKVLYEPSPEVLTVAIDLVTPLPCLVLPTADPAEHAETPVTALLSGRSIWQLSLDGGSTSFGSIDGFAAMGEISDHILEAKSGLDLENQQDTSAAPPPEAVPAEQVKFCGGCGAEAKADMKFCTQCGTAL